MPAVKAPQTIIVPTIAQLQKPSYRARLWITIINLPHSRRQMLEEIVNAFRDYRGTIMNADGSPYSLSDVDEEFGDDADCRWFSVYMRANPRGDGPRHPTRKVKRLEVLALFCWIRYPDIAGHFDR